jgi:hypothetical protein
MNKTAPGLTPRHRAQRTSRCPLARLHHALPKLLLWAVLAVAAAVGAITTIGTASAHAVSVTETPGLVSVSLDADEVQLAAGDDGAAYREGVCLTEMHLPGQPCANSLLACITPNASLRVPLEVTLDSREGTLRECLRNP